MSAPTDHEVSTALEALRELQRDADRGWPDGYNQGAVLARAAAGMAVLYLAIEAAPETERAALARQFVVATQVKPFKATVPPRKRRGEKS